MSKEDIDCIEAIAKIVSDLDLESVDYNKDGLHIIVNNRSKETVVTTVAAPAAVAAPVVAAPTSVVNETVMTAQPTVKGEIIKSPMVGVLYLSASPEAADYVKVGDTVQEGDVLCLIEAMKTFNQIKAPRSGVVREILAASGSAVEYDEPLFVIE